LATKRRESWRPTLQQELLIRAAWRADDEARDAWEQLSESAQFEQLDAGSVRILPLLYRNLHKLGIEHPALAQLRAVYRRTWVSNQIMLRQLESVVAKFEDNGVPTLLLKGVAMLAHYYEDVGTRIMADLDILVPTEQCDVAIQTLLDSGWRPYNRSIAKLSASYRRPFHAVPFVHKKLNVSLDLHWHVSHYHLNASYDRPFWQEAIPIRVGSVTTRVLCPTDQMIHTCLHGLIHELGDNIRWLPDVLRVLSHDPKIDWDGFVVQCQQLTITAPMMKVVSYLRNSWGFQVPNSVTVALAQTPVRYETKRLYESIMTATWERTWQQALWLRYGQYRSIEPDSSPWSRPLGFVYFLQQRWLLDTPNAMLSGAVARSFKRLSKRREHRAIWPSGYP
jgi:hypothetical protein